MALPCPTLESIAIASSRRAELLSQLEAAEVELATLLSLRANKRAALLRECERMLSGDEHFWEVRDSARVLRRLAQFVEN